MSKLMQSQLLS